MSVEKFIINKESSNYTIIPNKVLQNLRDAEALALWCYLQSLPPGWVFHKNKIKEQFGWGRDKLDKKLSVLKVHNLVEPRVVRGIKGKFTEWTLDVKNGDNFTIDQNTDFQCTGELSTEISQICSKNSPEYGLPGTGQPGTGPDTPINTIFNKNKIYKKSFYKDLYKEQKQENEKKHAFAESMNQMANEKKYIEVHEKEKYAPMPDNLRELCKRLKRC